VLQITLSHITTCRRR